jgi:hypothetical protein
MSGSSSSAPADLPPKVDEVTFLVRLSLPLFCAVEISPWSLSHLAFSSLYKIL